MNIILIGFMASGKSTVGQTLAKKLGYDFVDTDDLIEEKTGKSIAEIFVNYGEMKFREYETEIVRSLKDFDNKVIATGGGIIMKEENRQALKAAGIVVYLKVTPEDVLARVKDHRTRPLINYDDKNKRRQIIEDLLEKRENYYQDAANIVIDTNTGDIKGDVAKICKQLELN